MNTLFSSARAKNQARAPCRSTRSRPCTRALNWALGPCVHTFFVSSRALYPQTTALISHNSLLCYISKMASDGAKWSKDEAIALIYAYSDAKTSATTMSTNRELYASIQRLLEQNNAVKRCPCHHLRVSCTNRLGHATGLPSYVSEVTVCPIYTFKFSH